MYKVGSHQCDIMLSIQSSDNYCVAYVFLYLFCVEYFACVLFVFCYFQSNLVSKTDSNACTNSLICGNHANGTRNLSCIVSSIIICLYVFQIIMNYCIIVFRYRNKLILIPILDYQCFNMFRYSSRRFKNMLVFRGKIIKASKFFIKTNHYN